MRPLFRGLLLPFLLCVWCRAALAEEAPIGTAEVIVAEVSAQASGAKRRLAAEDAVRFRELIATAAASAAVIALRDGTELAMGENAQLRLDEFVYSEGADAKLTLSLGLGALRFVTGTMAKPAYDIHTPKASLTVRGTAFDLAVGEDGAAYVAVSEGAITVDTASGQSIDVRAGQSLSIDAAGMADLPRPTAVAPPGLLPGKIATMDLSLAEHIADLDADALRDLSVLDPSRTLTHDLPGSGIRDQPGTGPDRNKRDKDKPESKDHPSKR